MSGRMEPDTASDEHPLANTGPLTTCVAKGDNEGFQVSASVACCLLSHSQLIVCLLCIQLHLTHKSDLNEGNWVGASPLMLAVQYNRVKMAKVGATSSHFVCLKLFILFAILLP